MILLMDFAQFSGPAYACIYHELRFGTFASGLGKTLLTIMKITIKISSKSRLSKGLDSRRGQ